MSKSKTLGQVVAELRGLKSLKHKLLKEYELALKVAPKLSLTTRQLQMIGDLTVKELGGSSE